MPTQIGCLGRISQLVSHNEDINFLNINWEKGKRLLGSIKV